MNFFYELYEQLKEIDSSVYAGLSVIGTFAISVGYLFKGYKESKRSLKEENLENIIK